MPTETVIKNNQAEKWTKEDQKALEELQRTVESGEKRLAEIYKELEEIEKEKQKIRTNETSTVTERQSATSQITPKVTEEEKGHASIKENMGVKKDSALDGKQEIQRNVNAIIAELPPKEQEELKEDYREEKTKIDFNSWIKNKLARIVSGIDTSASNLYKKITIKTLKKGILIAGIYLGSSFITSGFVKNTEKPLVDTEETLENVMLGPNIIQDLEVYNGLSQNAKNVYNANAPIEGIGVKEKEAYVIADKENACVMIFDADNNLVKKFPAIFGAAKGEVFNEASSSSDEPGPYATTPMGTYRIGRQGMDRENVQFYRGKIFSIYKTPANLALHITYPGEIEKRTKALGTSTIEDNKMSWGCINISEENFDEYVTPNIGENARLYILPDNGGEVFSPRF